MRTATLTKSKINSKRPSTPDQILRARAGTNTRAIVTRLLAAYDGADEMAKVDGRNWYGWFHDQCQTMAADTGASLAHTVAVVSHLSPRVSVARNLALAHSLLSTGQAPLAMNGPLTRARAALSSRDPEATFGGPKTRSFFRAILGDRESVTVDVWAVRAALGDRQDCETVLSRVGVYDAVARAYTIAAAYRGETPREMQAIIWCAIRGSAR